jgi:hypothetical protein
LFFICIAICILGIASIFILPLFGVALLCSKKTPNQSMVIVSPQNQGQVYGQQQQQQQVYGQQQQQQGLIKIYFQ